MRSITLSALAIATSLLAMPAYAKNTTTIAEIVGFECGDNCYLTIKTKAGKEIDALCSIDLCTGWYENQSMPPKYKGRKVKVIIGTGKQYDGAGNEMGDFPEIIRLSFVKK